jgi:uncharacterized protein YkwD
MVIRLWRSLFFVLAGIILSFFIVGSGEAIKLTYTPVAPNLTAMAAAYPVSAKDLLTLTNRDRSANGLAPLKINPKLTSSALTKCSDMVQRNYWGHSDPDGTPFYKIIEAAGVKNYSTLGENLAIGQTDADSVNTDWINSPAHRDNILNPKFSQVGIAVCKYPNYTPDGQAAFISVQHLAAS